MVGITDSISPNNLSIRAEKIIRPRLDYVPLAFVMPSRGPPVPTGRLEVAMNIQKSPEVTRISAICISLADSIESRSRLRSPTRITFRRGKRASAVVMCIEVVVSAGGIYAPTIPNREFPLTIIADMTLGPCKTDDSTCQ